MFASKPETLTPPISYPATLLRLAGALAFFDGLLYLLALLGMRFLGPNLHALTTIARYFRSHTANPPAQQVIDLLLAREVYLQSELKASTETFLRAHDTYVWAIWTWSLGGLLAWTVLLLLFAGLLRRLRRSHEGQALDSPMGVQSRGIFVRCPFPIPQLLRCALHPSRGDRLRAFVTRRAGRRRPAWAEGVTLATPLATALLEHYLAYPAWPAELPDYGAAPRAAASPAPTTLVRHHGTTSLGEHVMAVRERALTLADKYTLPPAMVEQAALAHDLGKLVTFRLEENHWLNVFGHHDRISGQLLAHMAEWQALPPKDAEDLRIAVRFHHAPERQTPIPADTSARAIRLIELLSLAHKETNWWGLTASADVPGDCSSPAPVPSGAPPPAPSAAPASASVLPVLPVTPAPPAAAAPPEAAPPADPAPADGESATPRVQLTLPSLQRRPAEIPILPDLASQLDADLDVALPYLRVNSVADFAGLTIPDTDLVMVLDHHIRKLVGGRLSEEDRDRLRIDPLEAATGAAAKNPPHPSAANIAAALRRKGYLAERYRGQPGSLWRVEVGRRTWFACWLLRRSALPEAVTAAWPATPRFMPVPSQPSWLDPDSPEAAPSAGPAAPLPQRPPPAPPASAPRVAAEPEPPLPPHRPR
jgi:hypothetical protein